MCSKAMPIPATQAIPVQLPLAGSLFDELITESTEFAIAHGIVMRRNGVLAPTPFSLLPSPMPRALFMVRWMTIDRALHSFR